MQSDQPLAETPAEALAEACRARWSVWITFFKSEHNGDALARQRLYGQAVERLGQNFVAFQVGRDEHQVMQFLKARDVVPQCEPVATLGGMQASDTNEEADRELTRPPQPIARECDQEIAK